MRDRSALLISYLCYRRQRIILNCCTITPRKNLWKVKELQTRSDIGTIVFVAFVLGNWQVFNQGMGVSPSCPNYSTCMQCFSVVILLVFNLVWTNCCRFCAKDKLHWHSTLFQFLLGDFAQMIVNIAIEDFLAMIEQYDSDFLRVAS